MDTFDNIGYLAAQCDMREAESTTEHERNHWHARAEQLRRTQESFGESSRLTARSIIAEMEEVGSERIEDYRNLEDTSMVLTYCTTREQALRYAIAENGVPCHVIDNSNVTVKLFGVLLNPPETVVGFRNGWVYNHHIFRPIVPST